MTWQNPWALLGLLAIAVPVIIHLLGRRSARIRKFPSLRFIGTSRLMATRWTRLSDIGLMVVRMGIIAAAVAALARPLLLTADRQVSRGRSLARAIIVDTSASMRRGAQSGAAGESALDVARREAQRLVAESGPSVVVQSSAPGGAVAGALGWLETRRGLREVVVISDFQVGALDAVDLASIPDDIGIGLVRVDVPATPPPIITASRHGSAEIVARATPDLDGTDVEWSVRGPAGVSERDAVLTLSGAGERARADAAREAALTMSAVVPDTTRAVAIVHPGYEQRAQLIRDAGPLSVAWQGDVIARLRADSILVATASVAQVTGGGAGPGRGSEPSARPPGGSPGSAERLLSSAPFVPVANGVSGRPIAVAARGTVDGVDRLLIFSLVDAGSLASAAVIAAAMRAASLTLPIAELEPTTLPEQTLAAWRRGAAAGPAAAVADDTLSDGRWLWVLALVLMGVETWMRRGRVETRAMEAARERAA